MRFYFSSCYSLGNRQTIFSCLIKSETNPRRDQTLFLFFALLLWPQGSKAFRICQTLRVFIYKMSIRDRHTKKAVHTGPSESATSPSRIVLVILEPTLLVTRRPPDNEGPREGKSCKNSSKATYHTGWIKCMN